jgi:hypothetical protein
MKAIQLELEGEKKSKIFRHLNSTLKKSICCLDNGVHFTAPHTRSPVVALEDYQIINGGQTSHSLFEVHKKTPEKLESVELLVRICEAKKEDPLSENISETSNNQIPVGNRDLHSNDLIQRKLEEEFETLGLFYERKPSQFADEPKEKVLSNEILGQLFMAYHLEMPSEAKNNKSKVFSDLYDQIFDEMIINAEELLRLYDLYKPLLVQKKEVQKKKRKKELISEKEAFVSRAIFHIINGTKYFFDDALNIIDQKDISQPEKRKEKKEVLEGKGDEFTKQVTEIIYEVVEEQMKLRGEIYTHDKFFKEFPTNSIIKNKILEEIKSSKTI